MFMVPNSQDKENCKDYKLTQYDYSDGLSFLFYKCRSLQHEKHAFHEKQKEVKGKSDQNYPICL